MADDVKKVAVVLVHGIGSQRQAGPLSVWTGALLKWLGHWRGAPGGWQESRTDDNEWPRSVRLVQSDPGGGNTPATAELFVKRGAGRCHMHIVEAHWADEVVPPTFSALTMWVLRLLGLAVTYHIAAMLGSAVQRNGEWWRRENTAARLWAATRMIGTGVGFLLAPLITATLTPIVAILLIALLVLGMLGSLVPSLGGVALTLHRVINASLGDTLFVLSNDVQRGFIIAKVRKAITTAFSAVGEDGRVVLLAHSQGAWVAHQTLLETSLPDRKIELITFGQGLMKIERLRDQRRTQRIGLLVGPLLTPLLAWIALSLPDAVTLEKLGQGLQLLALGLTLLAPFLLFSVFLIKVGNRICDEVERMAYTKPRSFSGGTLGLDMQWVRGLLNFFGPLLSIWMLNVVYQWLKDTRFVVWAEQLESVVAEPTMHLLGLSLIAFGYTAFALYKIQHAQILIPNSVCQWHDLYASADPVSNGPLPGAQSVTLAELADRREYCAEDQPPLTTTCLYNHRDLVRDHVAYWSNREQFVAAIAHLLLPMYWVPRRVLKEGDQLRRRAVHACVVVRLFVLAFIPWAGVRLQDVTLKDLPAWIAVPDVTLPAGTEGWVIAIAGALAVTLVAEAVVGSLLRSGYDPSRSQENEEYIAETGAANEANELRDTQPIESTVESTVQRTPT